MSEKPTKIDAAKIATLLEARKRNHHRTVLLLGARAGGLFRNQEFSSMIQTFGSSDFNNLSKLDQFGKCYHILLNPGNFSDGDLHSILRKALQNTSVTASDLYLADLIKQNLFDTVITTNIDDLLEQALSILGLQKSLDFGLFIPMQGSNKLFEYSEGQIPFRIFKAFGDFGLVKYNIAQRDTQIDSHDDLKSHLERHLKRDVLVIGLDPQWDGDIIGAFPPRTKNSNTFWYVNEEEHNDHPNLSRAWKGGSMQYITGEDGSYDNFLKALYNHLRKKMPSSFQVPSLILTTLKQRYMESIANRIDELKLIDNAFKVLLDEKHPLPTPIIDFYGAGGIGKTAILKHVAKKCNEHHLPCIWAEVNQGVLKFSPESIEQIKPYSLGSSRNEDLLDQSVHAIKVLLALGPVVIVVDSIDAANEEIINRLEKMLRELIAHNRLFVVLSSKIALIFEKERDIAKKLITHSLKPLDRESCEIYLSSITSDIDIEVRKIIFEWTRGYPLAVNIMAQAILNLNLDPREVQDQKRILAIMTEQVINHGILANIAPPALAKCQTLLSLLSVPRRFNFEIMQDMIEKFAPEYKLESSLVYMSLPKRISPKTDLLNWNISRGGFSVNESVRNIFLLKYKIEHHEDFHTIHAFLAQINKRLAESVTGSDRIRHLREYLYHSAYTSNAQDLLQILEQTVQKIINESNETLIQFREEFIQDKEIEEALGSHTRIVLSLIAQYQAQMHWQLAKTSSGSIHIYHLQEFLLSPLQDPTAIDLSLVLKQHLHMIREVESAEACEALHKELSLDNQLKETLGENFGIISSLIQDDSLGG